jgi:hypothetical protein
LAANQPEPRSGDLIRSGRIGSVVRGKRTSLLPIAAPAGAVEGSEYLRRFVSRLGGVRPAERGSATSMNDTTVDPMRMTAVGVLPKFWNALAARALPLSVSSVFPSPRTRRDLSVTGAVNAFVVTRS